MKLSLYIVISITACALFIFLKFRQPSAHLTADIALINSDLSTLTASEFRQGIDRHFPITELIDDPNDSFHKDQLCQIMGMGDKPGTAMEITSAFCRYLEVILPFDCPQKEKDIFCKYIETLLKLRFDSPEEDSYTNLLGLIINDTWPGWGVPRTTWDDIKTAWVNSELYQFLQNKRLPKSERLRSRILNAECYKRKYKVPGML